MLILDELTDQLLLVERTDEQLVVVLCDNETLQALNNDTTLLGGMDDAIARVVQIDVRPDTSIVEGIMRCDLMQRPPRAKIAPSEVGGQDIDLLGFLHDSVVDGDRRTKRELTIDGFLLLGGPINGHHVLEYSRNVRSIDTYGVDNSGNAEKEDAAVPEEVLTTDITFGRSYVGLLVEGIHTEHLTIAGTRLAEIRLDVAITCLRTCRVHAKREYGIGLDRERQGRLDDTPELCRIKYDMIGRRNDNVSSWVLLLDAPAGIGNAGSSIPSAGFEEDVILRQLRKLLGYDISVSGTRDDPYILRRTNIAESVECELQQRASTTQDIDELLGLLWSTHWPETASDAACHDDKMIAHTFLFINEGQAHACP